MTSFIVVATDKTQREAFINNFCTEQKIDVFDRTILTLDNSVKNTQSIGIEDVKLMQKKIFLKPLKSQTKAVIIEDAQLLTHEAQNALLKVLEEPPDHTILILSADNKENLLATIISRCKVIQLEEDGLKLSEKEKIELETFITELPQWGIGERLKKAEVLAKDKEKAIKWLEKVILVSREQLLEQARGTRDTRGTLDTLRSLQSLHTQLKTTNVNPRFAIENALLNI